MEPILVILTVLAVVLIAGTFFFVNRSTGRRGPDLEPPARGGVLTERRSEPDVATPEESAAGGSTAVLDREPSVLEPTVPQPEVVEPEVVEPVRKPSLRVPRSNPNR